jgi:hypothetical protein
MADRFESGPVRRTRTVSPSPFPPTLGFATRIRVDSRAGPCDATVVSIRDERSAPATELVVTAGEDFELEHGP